MTINDCHAEFAVLDDLQLVRVNVRGDLNYKALTDIVSAARACLSVEVITVCMTYEPAIY